MSDAPTPLPPDQPPASRVFDAKFIMALIVLIAGFAGMGLVLLGSVPTDHKDMVLMILTAVIGFSGQVLGYFFGSSAGSASKNDTLTDLVKK